MTYYPYYSVFNEDPNYLVTIDAFELIVDPDTYTASEIDFFASYGIEPATKNPDGSITVKTQALADYQGGVS